MSFESLKYPRTKEKLETTKKDMEYLHKSIQEFLPPQELFNSNPTKKFFLTYIKGANSWPQIIIGAENEKQLREVSISLSGFSSDNRHFSYLISREEEINVNHDRPTDFLEQDRCVFEDKCKNIQNGLKTAERKDLIDGWDAIPK